ncbi:putative ABC-type ATPase [Xylophilus ampelinus]|uniref:Putative ABC-type ATPase n=2 Tax=Xylophilus ampelinus TaxID=54067 RepID=A0A318SG96_9BURK|nr:putative ABC-type ATPase [Xylophilus ampelinus]
MFAGPNGSGKSTINAELLAAPAFGFRGEYINADDIAKGLKSSMPDATDLERNIEAANQAEKQRLDALQAGRSFAFETVMSTPEKVAILTQAKAAGFEVTVVFVTTSSAEINVGRVDNRVKEGGHAVDPNTVRKRYDSAMKLLACALDHADTALIYDNSADKAVPVAFKQNDGQLKRFTPEPPAWYITHAEKPLQARQQSREALQQVVKTKATNAQATATDADASHAKSYKGPILELTQHHALQQLRTGVDRFVMHDRSLLAPQDMPKNDVHTSVTYAYDKGKLALPPQVHKKKHTPKV